MDNNFEENKASETSNESFPQNIPQDNPAANVPPQQQYIPPQGMPYYPNAGGYPPPVPPQNPPKPKRFGGFVFWFLGAVVVAMLVFIVIFAYKIADRAEQKPPSDSAQAPVYTQEANRNVTIDIPAAEKPVLEEKYYEDEATGRLTTVGVAKVILPSQVQIKVFVDVPFVPVSTGSGVIISEDGYILTNAHVVDGATQLSVLFYDGSEAEAAVVGVDKKSDLAVVRVDKKGLTPAQFGKSSSLVIGEEIALAGAGGGFENTVTYGHVTGLEREINTDYISSSTILCIQSDAALNPGNSGGALVNMYGQVVGIAVALMNHETYENIGFSIAIDDALPIAEDLIAYGYVTSRTKVGISYLALGDAAASEYGVQSGLCVMSVDPTCDVINAGLKPYDIITEIDGVRTFGAEEIADVLAGKVPGDTIVITVMRKNVTGDVKIFQKEVKLSADVSSVSGYSVAPEETNFKERDIIK